MLNEYWAHAVPAVAEEGGMVERFAGDAVMVVFNAAEDQADHAARAARAGLGLQKAAAKLGERHLDWPRFRVGVNSGPALVGNVGSAEHRSFTAIGDTTNLASRLQTAAGPGQVVIGERTFAELGDDAVAEPLDPFPSRARASPSRRSCSSKLVNLRAMANVQLTWLGHAAFRFDTPGGKRVYVDPFLDNPKCPENEQDPERGRAVVTHGHGDHLGSVEISGTR